MAKVMVRRKEDLERALKSFKTRCRREGILQEVKERRYYSKPSVKKKTDARKRKRLQQKRNQTF
ncbi:MAG: 30S ribosomal protein S21 [Candidatus Omnitrophica bacterium]|nr:30S ribosomal protein S21 [Candidatus Omnitrophota bacterium]